LPTWKCPFFASRETDAFYWGGPIENCGLCVNWCESNCLHQEKLKDLGENDLGKKNVYDDSIDVVYNLVDDGGSYGS
jgi:hypothetical protein